MREKIIEILNELCPGNDFENETATSTTASSIPSTS